MPEQFDEWDHEAAGDALQRESHDSRSPNVFLFFRRACSAGDHHQRDGCSLGTQDQSDGLLHRHPLGRIVLCESRHGKYFG